MGPDVSQSVSPRLFSEITDVTMADEDTNPTLTDDANMAILGIVAMPAAPSGGQNCNYWKWHHLVAKLLTNAMRLDGIYYGY